MVRTLLVLALACSASGATLSEARPAAARPALGAPKMEQGSPIVAASKVSPSPKGVMHMAAAAVAAAPKKVDVALIMYFVFWYYGNAVYNMYNTMALKAVGGKHSGMTMTVSTMQLGICTLYAGLLWLINFNPINLLGLQKPDKMPVPKINQKDLLDTVPVGACAAAAHSAGVFCLGADPLFGQIVKAGEPVLSAAVNTVFYGRPPTLPKVFCLFFIVAGVAFASLKKNLETGKYGLKFDERALLFGMLANAFAAVKGAENKKLMVKEGIKDRMGGVANQFALTEVLGFFISIPVMLATEWSKLGEFFKLLMTDSKLQTGLALSGMAFYLYNELATMTIKKTGPVTQSVANTAKRVIVLVFMSAVTKKPLTTEQKIGSAIAIGFVMLYSVIDDLIKSLKAKMA